MKITNEVVKQCYFYSKKVYNNQMDKTTATNYLYSEVGMNQGSAGDYITAFNSMMKGDRYTRTINTEATRYYLENIHKEYGKTKLHTALKAVDQHINYYGKLGHGRLRSIEKVINEYRTKLK